jgi:hypothetical protein
MTPRPLPGPEIYDGILDLNLPDDVQGWHSTHEIFAKLIAEVAPKTILECGSWKGASAIHMAKLAPFSTLYACDSWLGGIDHDLNQEEETSILERERGYPLLYRQFLFNVAKAGLQKQIVPVVQTSVNAARLLRAHKITADLIYIDASHEGMDPFFDIIAYWPLLKKGGVMFGDDWGVPDVKASVMRFLCEAKVWPRLELCQDTFWIIRKP